MQGRGLVYKNLLYSVLANGMNLFMSMFIAFIIPKFLGVEEYSYWQLYAFYSSYVGFFHFGWADGIYLRFGGMKYENLDKEYFSTQFWLIFCLEIAVFSGIAILSSVFVDSMNKQFILIMTGLCCLIQVPRTMLQYLLQTTNRIKDYAQNYMLEKTVYALMILFAIIIGEKSYKMLLSADLISKAGTLLLLCISCRDIVCRPVKGFIDGIREAWVNISVGVKLMLANISSLLLTGIIRFAIENYWSIETFGKLSLTMAVSNMLMVFISAVSVVMYPMLKNTPENMLPELYIDLRNTLIFLALGMLIFYYPAKVVLSAWLPKYAESLRYMALLFPMCVFESKMSMLINTYLKALRKEGIIMAVNWIMVAVAFVSTTVLVYIMHNLTLTVVSLTALLGMRSTVAEFLLAKYLKIPIKKEIFMELLLTTIFVICSWLLNGWYSTIVYSILYAVYLLGHRNSIKRTVDFVKNRNV